MIAAFLVFIAIIAVLVLLAGMIKVGIFALKVLLFGLLVAWLARKVFAWSRPLSSKSVLVGAPVADIAAPSEPRRDKYDIAAERELDEELGI